MGTKALKKARTGLRDSQELSAQTVGLTTFHRCTCFFRTSLCAQVLLRRLVSFELIFLAPMAAAVRMVVWAAGEGTEHAAARQRAAAA